MMTQNVALDEINKMVDMLKSNLRITCLDSLRTAPNFSTFEFNSKVYGYKLPYKESLRLYVTIRPGGVLRSDKRCNYTLIDGLCRDMRSSPDGLHLISAGGAHLIVDFF